MDVRGKMKNITSPLLILIMAVTILLVGCEETAQLVDSFTSKDNASVKKNETATNVTKNFSDTKNVSLNNTNNTIQAICIDTDGGVNYTLKGIVTVNTNGTLKNYTDYCRHGSYEDYILEYSCRNAALTSESYRCPKGCNNNGACW